MATISLLVKVKGTPEEIFEQLTTADGIEKWLTKASYSSDEDSGELRLRLWGDTDFIVRESTPVSRVVWHCVSQDNRWFGTDIIFRLRPESDRTVVLFDHDGWPEISDFFRDCATSWAYFLLSLQSLIEKGVGTPEDMSTYDKATDT